MTDRSVVVRQMVENLLTVEESISQLLHGLRPVVRTSPTAAQYLEELGQMVEQQRETLATHLKALSGSETRSARVPAEPWAELGDGSIARALRATYAALNYGTASYTAAFEVALRLYDPPLRKIAPEHLKNYADGVQRLEHLLAGVVAWELQQDGLECHCICPMCSIGACGCVAFATATLLETRPRPVSVAETTAGFLLQPPRTGSQLAQADVQGGDRLVAIDGAPVNRIPEIQAAIRKHQLGEEVRLTIVHDMEGSREVIVRHVGDYPRA